jgi:hypothetical protein
VLPQGVGCSLRREACATEDLMVKILNETTVVPIERTANRIMEKLASAGAHSIVIEHGKTSEEAAYPVGIRFAFPTPHGYRFFSFEVDHKPLLKLLEPKRKPWGWKPNKMMVDKARRIVWRNKQIAIELMLAEIAMGTATMDRAMLADMEVRPGVTTYQLYVDEMLALPPGGDRE